MSTPERNAIYRVFGEENALLYIGVTNRVPIRWNGHERVQPWWDELRSLTVEWYETREEAEAAEKAAILAEQPKYNVTYLKPLRGKGKPGQPEAARVEPLPDLALEPRDDDEDLLDAHDITKMLRLQVPGQAKHALRATGGPKGIRFGPHVVWRKGEIRRWIAAVEASQNLHAAAATRQAPKKREKAPRPPRAAAEDGVLFDRDAVLQVIPGGAA